MGPIAMRGGRGIWLFYCSLSMRLLGPEQALLTQFYTMVTQQQQTQVLQHLIPPLPCCCFILGQEKSIWLEVFSEENKSKERLD